jgi:hypothetical protein
MSEYKIKIGRLVVSSLKHIVMLINTAILHV